ncbi:MAG: hypothetical protein SGI92_33335 [Bryobacteraceae bacterium]|nr:hypothetical protein [Bryobacteraceae bacterium]
MSVRALLRRAALLAAAPILMAVSLPDDDVRTRETDVPPTEADQRFKAKYGIWPPHITYEKRQEQERSRTAEKDPKVKKQKPAVKPERERQ